MLIDHHFTVTFYPAPYPSEADGIVLQSADHGTADAGLAATHEQVVQRADYPRAVAPDYFPRGGNTTRLEWEEMRQIAPAGAAADAALAAIEALPDTSGWVKVELPSIDRAWAVSPAAIRSGGFTEDPVRGLVRLRWVVLGGPLDELGTQHDLLLEDGGRILLEGDDPDGILLETAP